MKSSKATKNAISPRNTFEPAGGDKGLSQLNSVNDDSREERKDD